MAERRTNNLEELSHKRYYEIADDQPDVDYWNIVDDSGKKIGEVRDLLFDRDEMKGKYLITNLKDGMFEEDRRVLIPVNKTRLDKENHRIILPKVTRGQMLGLPTYTKPDELTEDDEKKIRTSF